MGEESPKPSNDQAAELRQRMAAFVRMAPPPGQELKTPLGEAGVKLEPSCPTSQTIRGAISRVWATLWGRSGSALRIVRVDDSGRIVTRPIDWTDAQAVAAGGNFNQINWVASDLGQVVDCVSIFGIASVTEAEFSIDGINWYGLCGSDSAAVVIGANWTFLDRWIRCQHVRVRDFMNLSMAPFQIYGYTFPPQ